MSLIMAKGITEMETRRSDMARLTRKRFESFLRLGSVETARQTRELPKIEVRTMKTRTRERTHLAKSTWKSGKD